MAAHNKKYRRYRNSPGKALNKQTEVAAATKKQQTTTNSGVGGKGGGGWGQESDFQSCHIILIKMFSF